jgi:hypothetical protein
MTAQRRGKKSPFRQSCPQISQIHADETHDHRQANRAFLSSPSAKICAICGQAPDHEMTT